MKKADCLYNTILARTLMICLNLARTKRVLPFLLWNWHRLQSWWWGFCLAGTTFCTKCQKFSRNWHEHERFARWFEFVPWLAWHLARSAKYFARFGTMILVCALAGTNFGTKCPTFGTKLHEVARRMHEEGSMLFC